MIPDAMKSTKDYLRETFQEMYAELTDDELIARNRRKAERERRIAERREDTGL